MADDTQGNAKAIRLELSVPCDPRFRQVLAAMSQKMAAYLGYAADEATQVAEILTRATEGVCDADDVAAYTAFDVTFATNDETMEIRVRYVGAEVGARGPGVEQLLSQGRDRDTPLALMRRGMHTVEFGRDDGVEFCTLTKLLPNLE